tara:strand:+ start:856 stop:1317 length:462 start_codon:yes stop_codon:yes gene_type:complete
MSYATIDEVKTMFRDFADNSEAAVTDVEITLFLDNSTSIIDAKVGTLYVLPLTEGTNPESFKILKQLQMFKVACIIDDILNDYSEADKKPMWCKKAEALLNALVPPIDPKTCRQCPPTMKLPDAPYLGVPEQRGKMTISNTTGTIFKKGGDNW